MTRHLSLIPTIESEPEATPPSASAHAEPDRVAAGRPVMDVRLLIQFDGRAPVEVARLHHDRPPAFWTISDAALADLRTVLLAALSLEWSAARNEREAGP